MGVCFTCEGGGGPLGGWMFGLFLTLFRSSSGPIFLVLFFLYESSSD